MIPRARATPGALLPTNEGESMLYKYRKALWWFGLAGALLLARYSGAGIYLVCSAGWHFITKPEPKDWK